MIKFLALIFNSFALLIYSMFFAEVVTLTHKMPTSAKPDTEFLVEIKIKKGEASGFAKLQIEIPVGFTAIEDKSSGASFTFSNKAVKFVWMSMPSDKEIKISYKLKALASTSGEFNFTGKFSYIDDNVKQVVELPVAVVKIDAAANAQPIAKTEDKKTEPVETPVAKQVETVKEQTPAVQEQVPAVANNASSEGLKMVTSTADGIVCKREAPEVASGAFFVTVTINKGNLSGFAKYIEQMPKGFVVTPVETSGASFTYDDQRAKFVWLTLPNKPEFRIKYKVTITSDATNGKQNIEGSFSYIENDETKKLLVAASTIDVGGVVAPTIAENTQSEEKTKEVENDMAKTTVPVKEEKQTAASSIPLPQGSVSFSVQIAALQKAKAAEQVASIYNLSVPVKTEMADGLTKYTVGNYNEYKKGRDAREAMKAKGVKDAWVASYNDGKRITVQEALMISNQKWYR